MNALPLFLVTILGFGLIAALIIWIVSKLNLGLEADSFGSAIIAAIVITVIGGILTVLLGQTGLMDGNGLVIGLVQLIITALVLMLGARILPGLRVKGFVGALVAAVAIGAFYWLGGLLLGQLG